MASIRPAGHSAEGTTVSPGLRMGTTRRREDRGDRENPAGKADSAGDQIRAAKGRARFAPETQG